MAKVPSLSEAVTTLAGTFSGQLLRLGDLGYDEARKVHNGLIDKRPTLIARCRGLADIANSVNFPIRVEVDTDRGDNSSCLLRCAHRMLL
jgi:hypothetical protein